MYLHETSFTNNADAWKRKLDRAIKYGEPVGRGKLFALAVDLKEYTRRINKFRELYGKVVKLSEIDQSPFESIPGLLFLRPIFSSREKTIHWKHVV